MTATTVVVTPRTNPYLASVSETRQMWNGGPLRRWSATKSTKTPIGYSDGFVGSYVCAECLESCEGVYRVREPLKWLCGACRNKAGRSGGTER